MTLNSLSAALLTLVFATALSAPNLAFAATYNSGRSIAQEDDESIDSDLVEAELLTTDEEAPPAAEYPYPGAKEEGIVAAAPPPELPRPLKVDEETGMYFYGTSEDNGSKTYTPDTKPVEFSGREGVEKPASILANGEFHYVTEESGKNALASFRVGLFQPPAIENSKANPVVDFQEIYTKDALPVLFGDYEKTLTTKVGRLGLKFGSGIFVAQGKGVFAKKDDGRRANDVPEEQYTFLMFPNQLTAVYRFQYKDTQPIVPYVEGGGGYFTFMELRDDNDSPKFGGAATLVAAGGVNFLMDWVDPQAIRRLDTEYGINHVWLTTEFRAIVGLNKNYDFTSSVINIGFLTEF